MKHKNNGFTLFEVMAALTIMGSAITAVLTLGSSLFQAAVKSTGSFERMVHMKNLMNEAHEKKWWESDKKITRTIEHPALELTYSVQPIAEKTALKSIKNMVVEKVEVEWSDKKSQRKDTLVCFTYKPSKQDQEEGSASSIKQGKQ